MPEYKVLYDTKLRPLYAGFGDFRAHVDQLSFRMGWKQSLHALFLKAQYFNPVPVIRKTHFQPIANLLQSVTPSPILSSLVYDTSWYKETRAIGIVKTSETVYFVKIHAQPEECLFEERQARFVKEMFSGSFLTAPILVSAGNCLFFQFIPRLRAVQADDHIEERLLHLTKNFLDQHAITKDLSDCIPLDLFALCHGTQYADLGKKIRSWIEKNDQQIRHIPVHGDMTPWNMFVNQEEKIVLVDYERAGWQVPFYDLFHYVLQSQALAKNVKALEQILYRKNWFYAEGMRNLLILYVIDQFYLDLSDHKLKNFAHAGLLNLLETKSHWLETLLHDE